MKSGKNYKMIKYKTNLKCEWNKCRRGKKYHKKSVFSGLDYEYREKKYNNLYVTYITHIIFIILLLYEKLNVCVW